MLVINPINHHMYSVVPLRSESRNICLFQTFGKEWSFYCLVALELLCTYLAELISSMMPVGALRNMLDKLPFKQDPIGPAISDG